MTMQTLISLLDSFLRASRLDRDKGRALRGIDPAYVRGEGPKPRRLGDPPHKANLTCAQQEGGGYRSIKLP